MHCVVWDKNKWSEIRIMLVYASLIVEMIALRPPSYHTIDDPPPYPDDDDDADDDCPPPTTGVCDKRTPRERSVASVTTNRAGVERHLANCCEIVQLCHGVDADDRPTQPSVEDAVRRTRDAVGGRRRAPSELTTCDALGRDQRVDCRRAPWVDATACCGRVRSDDASTRHDDGGQFWRYRQQHHRQISFDQPPAAGYRSPFSPCASTVQADSESSSPRPADRSFAGGGVPYSVTCPSRFDGFLLDAAAAGRAPQIQPRPSASGEPVSSTAAVRPLTDGDGPRESRQRSSVFQISSYIIANRAADTSVQPGAAVEL